jgi:hypothetical protein
MYGANMLACFVRIRCSDAYMMQGAIHLQGRGQEKISCNGAVCRYIVALYWAVTTVSTTGYGDVTPGTRGEMLWAMFSMILGLSVFSYIVTSMASALKLVNATSVQQNEVREVLSQSAHVQ